MSMTFGEKLFKLRKGKGLSQEALAEKLSTSRQAISKWENDQAYPETEKLLLIGNIFEVSLDYLLKETVHEDVDDIDGYYVSKEMAEGYLLQEIRIAKYVALGFCILILSAVPYFLFSTDSIITLLSIIILATVGIVTVIAAALTEKHKYKVLKKEPLTLDDNYLKELTNRYEEFKKRAIPIIALGVGTLIIVGLFFFLEVEGISSGVLVPYYPISIAFSAIGIYIFIRFVAVLEAYKVLVDNDEYISKWWFRIRRKIRKKADKHL